MRLALKGKSQTVVTPRALERQALHELDDGRLVLEHLAGDPQAFGTRPSSSGSSHIDPSTQNPYTVRPGVR